VHRARLHDGRDVAVKVQYPGVGDAIETDLADQARFTKLLGRLAMRGLDADTFAREVRLRILDELDYTNEAAQQREFAERFAGHPVFRVPGVVSGLSNRVVLTSEWAQGLRWGSFVEQADQPTKDRVGEILARFSFAGTRRYRHFNADPNPGNYLVDPGGEFVTFLDFGLSKHVSPQQDRDMWLLVDSIMDHRSADEAVAGSIAGGYLKPDNGLDPEMVARFLYATGDFYEERPFTVTKEWFSDVARRSFLFEGEFAPLRNKLNTQADYFLRDRVYWGLLSILAELRATADWRAISEEYRTNAPASTPIGEAEATWIQQRAARTRG
jgi:predicted unusual protein kinase regulating ubiquinone biosynthesis (AarF/ABC1/UbiB family)